MLRLKTFTNIEDHKNAETTIDLDKITYVHPKGIGVFAVHMNCGGALVLSESEITMNKFIKKWKGEEE